jgi:hypothetical protein
LTWRAASAQIFGMKSFSAFAAGLLIGAVIICLFAFPFRYTILETSIVSGGQRLPVFVKFDRLTGKSWQRNAVQYNWTLIKDLQFPKSFRPLESTNSFSWQQATNSLGK